MQYRAYLRPDGPKTPDSLALVPKVCPYMSWRRIKMRSAAWGRTADEGWPSRSMARDVGSERSVDPGGKRQIGYPEWARRNGRLGDIHSIDDRYDHDPDALMG